MNVYLLIVPILSQTILKTSSKSSPFFKKNFKMKKKNLKKIKKMAQQQDDNGFVSVDFGTEDLQIDKVINTTTDLTSPIEEPPKAPVENKSANIPQATQEKQANETTETTETTMENEPPLLEELGIDFAEIGKNIVEHLNPFTSKTDTDGDVVGSLFFGFLLGVAILLTGKFRFGEVFGFTIVGSLAEYFIINLLAGKNIQFFVVLSNLGYTSFPLVALAFLSLFTKFVY